MRADQLSPIRLMTHAPERHLEIRALDRDECLTMLTRHVVGRIAFAFHDRVDIQPIHYLYSHGFLYGRTSEGAKLETIAHNRWVAFEVDEVRGAFDWTSVVVRGAFYRLDLAATSPKERQEAAHAVALLENVVPNTLSLGDPAPFRTVLFRIHVDEVTGRQAIQRA
jgi:nitroimidazol reductase NimA-like FMN-containing flavoprotein (pyridoxamine 5'-phosphate oxidase superfamily)